VSAFHEAMAVAVAASALSREYPQPCAQAYSKLGQFTPCGIHTAPDLVSSRWFPDTIGVGAAWIRPAESWPAWTWAAKAGRGGFASRQAATSSVPIHPRHGRVII